MEKLILLGEGATGFFSSLAIATSVDATPLLTVLITFATTLITMVGGELIKFLVAFLKKKTKELEDKKEEENKENKEE